MTDTKQFLNLLLNIELILNVYMFNILGSNPFFKERK